jgi:hypothetical protein
MKLFAVTENYKGRCCHWYVSWRKQELVDVPIRMREFFTKEEVAVFRRFARRRMRITVTPMPAVLPALSFEQRVEQAGWMPSAIDFNAEFDVNADAEFSVSCFEEGIRNPELRAIEAALAELEKEGKIESSLDDRTGVRRYWPTRKGLRAEKEGEIE